MASRRMFSIDIMTGDDFLDLPASTQALYVQLCLGADDDGFLNNPRRIVRMTGANPDDLERLVEEGFVLRFDKGIVAIKDWKIHNYIRKDVYTETKHKAEKSRLELDENGAYCVIVSGSSQPCSDAVTIPVAFCDDPLPIPKQHDTASVVESSTQERVGQERSVQESLVQGRAEKGSSGQDTAMPAERDAETSVIEVEQSVIEVEQSVMEVEQSVMETEQIVTEAPPPPLAESDVSKLQTETGNEVESFTSFDTLTGPKELLSLFSVLCPAYGGDNTLSPKRWVACLKFIETFTPLQIQVGLEKAQRSAFLQGDNPKHWHATFDWIIDPDNFAKILGGNYDAWQAPVKKKSEPEEGSTFDMQEFFEAALRRGEELLEG